MCDKCGEYGWWNRCEMRGMTLCEPCIFDWYCIQCGIEEPDRVQIGEDKYCRGCAETKMNDAMDLLIDLLEKMC